jgi:coenzyme F420-reducing hydrogenase alpha subunit
MYNLTPKDVTTVKGVIYLPKHGQAQDNKVFPTYDLCESCLTSVIAERTDHEAIELNNRYSNIENI